MKKFIYTLVANILWLYVMIDLWLLARHCVARKCNKVQIGFEVEIYAMTHENLLRWIDKHSSMENILE